MNRQQIAHDLIIRMEQERDRLGLTQAQMAQKLEMSLSGYKKVISGETQKIDIYTLYLLHQLTGKWFIEWVESDAGNSSLARKYFMLSENQQKFIEGIVDFELSIARDKHPAKDFITVFVPTGNMEDGMIYDSSNFIKVDVSAYRQQFGANLHCGIQITSNHLHPVYHIGDILLICRKAIRDGDTGIFIKKDTQAAYIRKFHQTSPCILEPINNLGEPFYVDSYDLDDMNQWIKFGYVLTKMKMVKEITP
ncbi:MAG: helix-turn-helix domain-containing protein [Roseburia sp.]